MFRLKLIRSIGKTLAAILVSIVYSAPQIVYAEEYSNFFGMRFVSVPAGSFKMGSATEKLGVKFDEMPQHKVSVSSFQIMTTEVTLAQFKRYIIESSKINILDDDFMNANGHDNNAPVVFVSWNDVRTFLHFLNKNKPSSDRGTYRLPTEAEWEYACRAGHNNLYCGSSTASEVAWYDSKTIAYQQVVAQKKANAFGLYDMSGNVREWVQDCYHANYENAPIDDSVWDKDCQSSKRVLRGGSWREEKTAARVTDRLAVKVSSRSPTIGFRAVREVP